MHTRRAGAKGLVFGGLMAALVAVFAVVPGLGIFMPIPLVLAYVRFGGRTALLTAAVAVLLATMFTTPIRTFGVLVPAGVMPGLAFGYGFRRKLKPLIIGALSVAVLIVGYAGTYVLTRVVVTNGRDPITIAAESPEFKQLAEPVYDLAENYIKGQPVKSDVDKQRLDNALAQLNESRNNLTGVAWALAPSVLFIVGAWSAWVNFMLCRWILPRLGHEIPLPTPFSEFRLPSWLTWVFLVVMFGNSYMGSSIVNAPWWLKLSMNVSQPLMLLFVLAGIAVAYGWLQKQEIAKPLTLAIIVAGLVLFGLPFGMQLYLILAMFDTLFDFRGLGHGMFKRPENP